MKKILTLLLLFVATIGFAQNSGITYQAVIYGPNGQQLPGANNQQYILANKTICLRFSIIDHTETVEYQETIVTTTDKFGMVNLLIGSGTQVSGYASGFTGILWNINTKSLKVELDTSQNCQNFTQISNNPFTYVPFAYFSANPGNPGPAGPAGPQGPAGANGLNGVDGMSAYQVWLNLGNTGTEADFIASLTGPAGPQGVAGTSGIAGMNGKNSLIISTLEPSGINCQDGGVKLEFGLDTNENNVLDSNEINNSLTKYVCNGNSNTSNNNGSSDYYQVQELYNNSEGPFISANGYANPQNYPYQLVHTYDNLSAKEFDFNLLNAVQRCFKLNISFKFYDINNNLINVTYFDKEQFQLYETNFGWTNNPVLNNVGSENNPIIYSRNDSNNGSAFLVNVLERNIKFKCQNLVKKIEITFGSSNVYVASPPCTGCTCGPNSYNGTTSYAGYITRIGYQLISYN